VALFGALMLEGMASAQGQRTQLRGRTSQGHQIKLVVRNRSVVIKHLTARLHCRGGAVLIDDESGFLPTPVRRGRISDKQFGSTDEVLIQGRLRGKRLQGKVRVRDRLGRARCDSGWIRFAAKR
jgi:hypothetical protein